jgi:hypothetical protein
MGDGAGRDYFIAMLGDGRRWVGVLWSKGKSIPSRISCTEEI